MSREEGCEGLSKTMPRMQRVEELFLAALDLPTAQRAVFLDQECRGDDELRQELDELLAAERRPLMGFPEPSRINPLQTRKLQPGGVATTERAAPGHSRSATSAEESGGPVLCAGSCIGQYELIRQLGRGGMGEVYLARDLRLGRLVALKLMIPQDPSDNLRFLTEARATARCHHENIVVIHEVAECQGHPFMVLEYLEGQTLRQWLCEHADASGQRAPVPPGRAVELMLPVVRALAYAHEHGIVHRDLKPENIILTRTGTIKVLDFGIAKLLSAPTLDGSSEANAGIAEVQSSALIGTLPYMSPEQMNVGAIDHRTDIWAVGIMLFELVTGAHPVPSRASSDLLRIADQSTPMPSVRERMPELGALGVVIDRCLIKDREHRTANARALLAELEPLAPSRRTTVVGNDGNPFAGLAAFQETDAGRFFGRDREANQIVTELRSRPLVAVIGPSGTGKSSLVRAGVIPALKRSGEGWDTHVVRPGREPLAALARVIAQVHNPDDSIERLRSEPGYLGARLRMRAAIQMRRVLIFVDQLEELYTLGAPPDERAAFLAALIAVADDAASPLRVVLAMRSDFLDRLTEDRRLGAEVTRGLVLLPPMGRDGMREALLRPVEDNEYRFESCELVDRIVNALDATPGALPLLQFMAARLWEQRDTDRRKLTEASYERLGGVAGALAAHADAVLAGMPSAQQTLARAVLERLVTPERTRGLMSVAELRALHCDPDLVNDVVEHLATMRLLVIERGAKSADHTVELVHESLIDRWPTLARWLGENHEHAVFLDQLRNAARQWEVRGRSADLLWRGETLEEARSWRRRYRGMLPQLDEQFLNAGFTLAARHTRIKRMTLAGTIVFLSLLVVAAAAALVMFRTAERLAGEQALVAHAAAIRADAKAAEALAAEAQLRAQLEALEGKQLAAEALATEAESSVQSEPPEGEPLPAGPTSMTSQTSVSSESCRKRPWHCGVTEEDKERAQALYAEGNQYFDKLWTEHAAKKYREALKHWDHPGINYNLMLCLVQRSKRTSPIRSRAALTLAGSAG